MSKNLDVKIYTNGEQNNNNRTLSVNSGKGIECGKKDVTLEMVVRDMTNVFYNLKDGISLVKAHPKRESIYNIENELEKIYHRQDEINKKREEKIKTKVIEADVKRGRQEPQLQKNNKMSNNSLKAGVKRPNSRSNSRSNNSRPNSRSNSSRPNSATQESKIVVTNLQFPIENKYNITNVPRNEIRARPSPWAAPNLRKPSQNTYKRKALSVPPPREVYNPLGILKDEVDRAIREKKTFTIKGQFSAVRRALLKRGWVEKYHITYRDKLNNELRKYQQHTVPELVELLKNKELAETVKKLIKSKLLKDHQVDLYWDHTFDAFKECPDSKKLTHINRFRRDSSSYTSKQGLCQAAREAHWLQIPGVARINHPRCYVLTKGGDTKTFLMDFGLTAAISLLKWIVKNNITKECKIVSESGKIPTRSFDFAVAECYKYIKKEKHLDIDEEIRDALEVEWNEFLTHFYKIIHTDNHFKLADKNAYADQETKGMVRKANYLLNQLREYMPYLDMDGYMNIWILKPTNSSRGIGIHICRNLEYILDIVRKNPNRRYVIQKYIERPLLIHETKFDIRQWFLVSSSYPLVIWIYRLCYLRFSSQTYNLRKLHESIHLTNNSVQAKYLQHGTKDPLLPAFGMWDSKQFKAYLSDIGYPSIFEEVIYPGMKQCIIGAMIAHRDKIDKRKNCFELYGADFMLSETFEPWILEINSNPALHASTPVTAKLCPAVLEDVIKVIVDYNRNSRAETGNFELIFKEKPQAHIHKKNQKLEITGTPVPEEYFCDIDVDDKQNVISVMPEKFETPDPGKFLIETGETMKEALKNLLEIVKREKLKRRSRKEKSVEAKSVTDDSFSNIRSELVSLFENATISKLNSNHSESVIGIDSQKGMSIARSI